VDQTLKLKCVFISNQIKNKTKTNCFGLTPKDGSGLVFGYTLHSTRHFCFSDLNPE